MLHVKSKTLLMFALSVVAIASVGFYFYTSLESLNTRVENSINPQKKSNYLKKIALDLNRLNNLYLVDSVELSREKVDSIIASVEVNLDSVKEVSGKSREQGDYSRLDTIPQLLREIKREYLTLEDIRQKSQERFLNDFEDVLKEELSTLNLSARDSITIIKQITSEIYENPVDHSGRLLVKDQLSGADKRNFFQRLFGRGGKDTTARENGDLPEPFLAEEVEADRDTVVSTAVDTLHMRQEAGEAPEMKIISIFEKVQKRRIRILDNLKQREKQIFRKNAEINNFIEGTLNEILFEELREFNLYIDNFSTASRRYIYETGAIILVFLVIGLIATYIIFRDINTSIFYQKKLELSEKRALREAEEKQKFLSTMSHELRTPLTSIIGYADMLDQDDENVQALQSACGYLYQMTNEILDMAKIKAGIIEIRNENFDLLEVLGRVRNNFEPLIINRGIQPLFLFPSAPVYVISDEYRIQQIVYNLVHNAIKYTEEGYIKLALEVHEDPEDTTALQVDIVIEDSGIGMSEEEQKTVFQDYQQAGTHKNKIKGTGLGLGIVRRVVREMGGTLTVESREGEGSRFVTGFVFKKGAAKTTAGEGTFVMAPDSLKGIRVFAVDDDPLITRLYEKLLVPYGAGFTAENNPEQALKRLETETFDLVIFDMKMPGMSGYELKQELENRGIRLARTIIATANVMLTDEDRRNMGSFDRTLFKPLRKTNVLKVVSELLDLEHRSTALPERPEKKERKYDLGDLKEYTGDDEEALRDMLGFLVSENNKELEIYREALDEEDYEALAHTIHKLASRFAQVRVTPPFATKALELNLRDRKKAALRQAGDLYRFWKQCNEELGEAC
ncbi:ATP-binding response regulator [Sinomicrobium soli]|uniref:ATP-binding response regulator n=1 Tax=Sinomicrobium sp. N-1-3-6 TaxID=2219864 RepID=UPI000DCEEFD5|nr:ATP-binding protein [Sinomicrobium sp. N-1-3-6]RAV28658.1 hybrid sensor histidine kinase/response regulator [Sinomicrobium sp. N-1-3-6]